MPVTSEHSPQFPPWSELSAFHVHRPESATTLPLHAISTSARHRLVVVRGDVRVGSARHRAPSVVDLTGTDDPPVATARSVVVELVGRWGDELGGCGVFAVEHTASPENRGDPAPYERTTSIDNHYHDCDEYWIIVDGAGTVVTEGISSTVGPGDCVITGMGDHHDFPDVSTPVLAVYFETTLGGDKRRGHLWEHTHGPATPVRSG